MNKIPIFFSFDNNYVVPAAVAFISLLETAKKDVFYNMYVLHSDITKENKEILLNIITTNQNANLEFIDTKDFLKDEWKNGAFDGHNIDNKQQFTIDTIVRCFAANFFPQLDKIIYSDVDIVFMDDISGSYDVNLNDKYIGAVKSAFIKYYKSELSHLSENHYNMLKDTYFAGGFWVMNLKKIREDNLENKMMEIVKDNSINKKWNDQDIMNIACENKVAYLSLRYISYPYMGKCLQDLNFVSHFSKEELIESIENPKILHFAAVKPWSSYPNKHHIWWDIFNRLKLKKTKIFKRPYMPYKYKIYYALWKFLNKKLEKKGFINH